MEKLYILTGSLLHLYQNIENELFLIYSHRNGINNIADVTDSKIDIIGKISNFDKVPLGNKIKKSETFFTKDEIDVLNYIKEQRNFLVHEFFIDTSIASTAKLLEKNEQLQQMKQDAILIEKALRTLIKTSETLQ